MIFAHANNLNFLGHEVTIISPFVLNKDASVKEKLLGFLKLLKYRIKVMSGKDRPDWFKLDPMVKIIRIENLAAENVPDTDVTIATANETADWLAAYPQSKGKKFYFIQDYEIWTRNKELVDSTWRMPLKKIVIAQRLKKLAETRFHEQVCGVVPNGIDTEQFFNENKKINTAKKILMMYHVLEKKGFFDGLKAFLIAKDKHSEISLTLFGAYRPGPEIAGYDFYYRPTPEELRKLYCQSDIFIWPSREEGFGLPPMEAMACKCAVISTDTGAIRDYAIDEQTVIIVPPNKPDQIGEKIIELIENEKKLSRLSLAGYEKIRGFTWERSTAMLEKIITK